MHALRDLFGAYFAVGSKRQRSSLPERCLSLYVYHHTGRWGLLRLALHALFGRLRQAHDFDMLTATDIHIETHKRRMRVATDGEVQLMQTPLSYRIRPASLEVIVPQAPASAATTASPPTGGLLDKLWGES